MFAENFSKISNLHNTGISSPTFHCRTNLKMHKIYVTPPLVRDVEINLDSVKASDPYCKTVPILNKFEDFYPF